MSEFKFIKSDNYETKTLDNSESAISDLTEKWYILDTSFNALMRPVHLSVGVMLLTVLIYELYSKE